jgi:hypothetical protein
MAQFPKLEDAATALQGKEMEELPMDDATEALCQLKISELGA